MRDALFMVTRHDRRGLGLAGALLGAAALAACGSAAPAPELAAPPAATSAAPAPRVSTPLRPSSLLAEVAAAGVDLSAGVKLAELPPGPKKKLMRLFTRSLGYEGCDGCHGLDERGKIDMKLETRNLQIARRMYDDYVLGLRTREGGLLFCDSCHDGSAKILDRADHAALKRFMKGEYVGKLSRADQSEHTCATCHGEHREGGGHHAHDIFGPLWGVAPK